MKTNVFKTFMAYKDVMMITDAEVNITFTVLIALYHYDVTANLEGDRIADSHRKFDKICS